MRLLVAACAVAGAVAVGRPMWVGAVAAAMAVGTATVLAPHGPRRRLLPLATVVAAAAIVLTLAR